MQGKGNVIKCISRTVSTFWKLFYLDITEDSEGAERGGALRPRAKKRIGSGMLCDGARRAKLFGGSLDEYVEATSEPIPLVITSTIRYVSPEFVKSSVENSKNEQLELLENNFLKVRQVIEFSVLSKKHIWDFWKLTSDFLLFAKYFKLSKLVASNAKIIPIQAHRA